jgi:hypothetical protein
VFRQIRSAITLPALSFTHTETSASAMT